MTILATVLGTAYTACIVWLVVRVVNRRERWAKRTLAVSVGAPLLYVASFVPLLWLEANGYIVNESWPWHACRIYATPIRVAYETGSRPLRAALDWYGTIFR